MPLKTRCKILLGAMLALGLAAFPGCGAGGGKLNRPEAPEAYLRRIVVVLEREDFRPAPGVPVRVETEAPTRLLEPAGGAGRTGARGELELVFEPLPHYDQSAWAGGDVIVDYPVKARLFIERAGRKTLEIILDDGESFARYADPLYQALNRDPERGLTYYTVTLP